MDLWEEYNKKKELTTKLKISKKCRKYIQKRGKRGRNKRNLRNTR
jgi:hypothetical protein